MEKQKNTLVIAAFMLFSIIARAQLPAGKYIFSKGTAVSFITNGVMTDIAAANSKAQGVIDFDAKMFAVKMRIDEFVFSNSLMQKHFLENYMESDKFPEAKYTGRFTATQLPNGDLQATLTGQLLIHGVSRPVVLQVVFSAKDGKIKGKMEFSIKTEEYGIKVPDLVFDKVGDKANITVVFELTKM
jgi:polyisoprenoid-binding protein YceI